MAGCAARATPVMPVVPVLLAPPPGSLAPTNLARVVIGLSGSGMLAAGELALVPAGGAPVAAQARLLRPGDPACPAQHSGCLALDLRETLAPDTGYQISGTRLTLTTGSQPDDDLPAAVVSRVGCTLRLRASEPVWAWLLLGGRSFAGDGLATEQVFVLDDAPPGLATAVISDVAQNETLITVADGEISPCGH